MPFFQNMETTTTSIEKTVTKLILNYCLNAIPGSFYVCAQKKTRVVSQRGTWDKLLQRIS